MRRIWEKWGYLAVLGACFALICIVAVFTPKEKAMEETPTPSPVQKVAPARTPMPRPVSETGETGEELMLCCPVNGEIVRGYAVEELNYDPMSGEYSTHDGVDFAGNMGDIVVCAGDGSVVKVWESERYGLCVEIAHRGGYFSRYGSLGDVRVQEGQKVKAGQVLGCVGCCLWEKDPHLHFSLRHLSQSLDPMLYIKDSLGS